MPRVRKTTDRAEGSSDPCHRGSPSTSGAPRGRRRRQVWAVISDLERGHRGGRRWRDVCGRGLTSVAWISDHAPIVCREIVVTCVVGMLSLGAGAEAEALGRRYMGSVACHEVRGAAPRAPQAEDLRAVVMDDVLLRRACALALSLRPSLCRRRHRRHRLRLRERGH